MLVWVLLKEGPKDARPWPQGASRYAATWGTTSSGKGEGLGVVVHTQARALLFRVERLPLLMSITATVYLQPAYPSPACTVTHGISLDTND